MMAKKKNMQVPTVELFDYSVYAGSLDDLYYENSGFIINTLNAYSYVLAKKDIPFKNALKNSSLLVADGFPVVLAARVLKGKKIRKIAGEDVFFHLLGYLNRNSLSCFFLGSSQGTLIKIEKRLAVEYPAIKAGFFSPPFKPVFSDEENKEIIMKINQFSPEVLFVGMTAPKQEKWVFTHKDEINANIITSIGAVFDFYAQTNPRPSRFWIRLNLEWLIRLLKEPRRLWKRYLVYSPLFFLDVISARIKQ
jgi:N-acetylglucosaminyldiphosphoundecaprenol N-acetyl-beta-D-mannosaminyltransferase